MVVLQLWESDSSAVELFDLIVWDAFSLERSGQMIGAPAVRQPALNLGRHFLVRNSEARRQRSRASLQHSTPRLLAEAYLLVVARHFASGNEGAGARVLRRFVAVNEAVAGLELAGWVRQAIAIGVDTTARTWKKESS